MEYQKIANLIDDASNQSSKLRANNWVEINMNQEQHTLLIAKSSLKLPCYKC